MSTTSYSPAQVQSRQHERSSGTPSIWIPEVEVLIACARLTLEDRDVNRLKIALSGRFDWERLTRLALLHRMTGFLSVNLASAAADFVPAEYLAALRGRFLSEGSEALRQTAELLNILQLLSNGGVFAVPYKGTALAQYVYGNLGYRLCSDVDILVSRKDVPRTRDILRDAGFVSFPPVSPAGREFILKTRHSEIYTRPASTPLELHWAFSKLRGVFPLDLDQLRPRLTTMSLAGAELPMFSDEDQILVLCVHAANHLWSRLEWLCGVSELMRTRNLEWPIIQSRAIQLRAERMLYLGVSLAHDVLDAPAPEAVLQRARSIKGVARAAATVKQRYATCHIEQAEPRNSFPRDVFRLRLQSTAGDRYRYVVHRLTTPSREDSRLMVPLGQRSIPLPALLRPFHVAAKLSGDLFKWASRR